MFTSDSFTRTTLLRQVVRFIFACTLMVGVASHLYGQATDNPTGPAGQFNGNIFTGGSYDPYTGNAMRSVTDIVVAGAVGEYPLALTRTANSRQFGGRYFGIGGWRHSYDWMLSDSVESLSLQPAFYDVSFPDGRTETFGVAVGDPYFRAGSTVERFIQLDLSTLLAYLVLPDGGKN